MHERLFFGAPTHFLPAPDLLGNNPSEGSPESDPYKGLVPIVVRLTTSGKGEVAPDSPVPSEN